MVRERNGVAGRPLQDALDPEPALEAICQTLEGKTEKQKNPSSQRVVGLCQLDLRAPWRMDGVLWQTRTHRHDARVAISQGHAPQLETP